MRKTRYIAVLLAVFLIAGCANLQKAKDPYQASYYAYLQALKWYTQSAEKYDMHYKIADKATQQAWKHDIDPIFINAKLLLDQWKIALGTETNYEDKYEQWKAIKTQLIMTGLKFLEE